MTNQKLEESFRTGPNAEKYKQNSEAKVKALRGPVAHTRLSQGEKIMMDELQEALGMSSAALVRAAIHGLYYAHFGIINPRAKKDE